MLLDRIRALFRLQYDYRDPYQLTIARDLLRYTIALSVVLGLGLVLPLVVGFFEPTPAVVLSIVVDYVLIVLIGYMVQTGRVFIGRNLLLALVVFATLNAAFQIELTLATLLSFLLPIAVAGLLSSRNVTVGVTLLTMGVFTYVILSQPVIDLTINADNRLTTLFSVLLIVVLIGQFAVIFGAAQQRIAQAFSRDTRSLMRSLELVELDTLNIDEPTLIAKSLRSLKSGFDRVQVYLVEQSTGSRATPYYESLDATVLTGEPVDLSAASAVSEAIRTGEVLTITPDSGDQRRRQLAAGMQMAVLVPLLADGKVLGVFDFQLSTVTTFSEAQMAVFQSYGRRLGLALARVRLLNQLYADVQLQQSVIAGLRRRIESLERETRREVDASTWQVYFQEVAKGALGYDIGSGAAMMALDQLPATTYASLHAGQIVMEPNGDKTLVMVPIRLRDVLLGALSFRIAGSQELNQRQQELIQDVVDRLALALENRRLLQQSQSQAQREAKASEVARLLFSETDLTALLSVAAGQFNEALGAVNTSVRVLSLEGGESS
ncbi:GAF domain-containing protein [Aggregatilineales bacterium SYSU G02658]